MRLSIIMPFYNKEEKVVRPAIESVLAQTERDLELICVNDASPDGSGDFLYEMAQKDKRLKVLTHEVNQGVSVARNTALAAAAGDYIGFVDSDDMVVPNYYEVMLKAAEITQADIISSSFRRIEYDETVIPEIDFNEEPLKNYRPCKKYYSFKARSIWNRIYKREILQGLRFVPELKVYEDLVFLNEAISRAESLCDIDFDGYLYRQFNPELLKPKENVQEQPPVEIKAELPWHLVQHNTALRKIAEIVVNGCDYRTANAMSYLVLRRFFRIALQIRKFDPAMQNLCYHAFSEFFESAMRNTCSGRFPVISFCTHRIFSRKKFSRIFIFNLQILRLLTEISFYCLH